MKLQNTSVRLALGQAVIVVLGRFRMTAHLFSRRPSSACHHDSRDVVVAGNSSLLSLHDRQSTHAWIADQLLPLP